jgi:SNF2 family DNA or RNA helicase
VSLLKFIRAHPYSDPKQFDTDIARLWKSGEGEEAVKRLKKLSASLLLRRAKDTIQLPTRRDVYCPIDFNQEERAVYTGIHQQTIVQLDEALQIDTRVSKGTAFVNILQQIESLRLFCNLGLHYRSRHDNLGKPYHEFGDWARLAQNTFNSQRQMTSMVCIQCTTVLELTETLLDEIDSARQKGQFSRCLKYLCGECAQKLNHHGHVMSCGHKPPCPTAPVFTSGGALEEIKDFEFGGAVPSRLDLPSKIKVLIADLRTVPRDVKR